MAAQELVKITLVEMTDSGSSGSGRHVVGRQDAKSANLGTRPTKLGCGCGVRCGGQGGKKKKAARV